MTAVAEKKNYRDVKLDPVQGPPDVHPSDPIYFYDGPAVGRVPQPGIVFRTNLGTSLQIGVFRPEFGTYQVKDGVKWCNDPTLRPDELEQNGCWDYHPRVKELREYKKQLADLLAAATKPDPKK